MRFKRTLMNAAATENRSRNIHEESREKHHDRQS